MTARNSSVRDRAGRATTTSSSGEDEPQRADIVHSESALIHAPPTSTITVSAPITTVASSTMTSATTVTPSCRTRPTVRVTRALFAVRHVPSIVLSPEVRAQINGQGQWEYYSERYVRGVGGERGGLVLPGQQPRVEQIPIPPAPRRDTQQRWYTPAQNYNEILEASETPGSEGSGEGSEVNDEVVEELARQGRRWRADEEARASEGERRAKELSDEAAKRTELEKKQGARKASERVRVKRIPRSDLRVNRERMEERQHSDSDSEWELVRKSKRRGRKDRVGAREYKDTEESSSSSTDDSARVRRRRYNSRRRDDKTKTRGRDRLAATSSESEPERNA